MYMSELERARAALAVIPPDLPRDEWHEVGRAALAAGLDVSDIDTWSATAGNYGGTKDVEASFRGISSDGGTTAGSLYYLAKEWGWKPSKDAKPHLPINHAKKAAQNRFKHVDDKKVFEVWQQCVPATENHDYVLKKQGTPDGLRVYPANAPPLVIRGQNVAGYLVISCWNDNNLQTLQFIPPDGGDKLNLPGASFNDGFFTVGEITDRVYIAEGIGQAWAINKATGAAAVVCFGAGRMARVAAVLRAKYPAAALAIVPDRSKESDAAKIAADVGAHWVEMPGDKPSNYDANDFAQEFGTESLADLLRNPKTPPQRYKLLSDNDLSKLPPLQWRIKGILPKEGLAAIYGASGSGKSFLVLDLIQAVAGGYDWFGSKTKPCGILYCALEGEGGIAGRVAAYRIRHGVTSSNIRYLVQPFSLLHGGDIKDLARAIQASGQGAEMVVLDTLNRAAPGADENDSQSMGEIIAAAKRLQTVIGGLVALIHHVGKDPSKGMRGHSSLLAALDVALEVRRDGDLREWSVTKAKDGEDGASHSFELQAVELGHDEDGEVVTSCAVRSLEGIVGSIKKVLPPKSGNQRLVWDALGEVFRRAGIFRPEGAPDSLPQGRPCIALEDAINISRTKLICDPKRQTERAQAAINGLVTKGLLCHESGFLWCK